MDETIRMANTITITATKTQARLSNVGLPKYNGDIKEWPNLKNIFTTLIHNNDTISTAQKYMFKNTLNGHTLSMIQSIPVQATTTM